jgi:hypothetical protein
MSASKVTPAKLRALAKAAGVLMWKISDARKDLPAAVNSEQQLTPGALSMAFEKMAQVESSLARAAKYLGDKRTEAQIDADHVRTLAENRADEHAEAQMRKHGFSNRE